MRSRLMVPVLLVALSACADRATSPLAPAAAALGFIPGESPPPEYETTTTFISGFQAATTLQTQYFLNKPGNNGFITFRNNTSSTYTTTPNARISYHNGVVSGQGVLTITGATGQSVFDFANVTAAFFKPNCVGGCGAFTVPGTFTPTGGQAVPTVGVGYVGGRTGGDFGVAGF